MITLEQGVELVWHALEDMVGGEIYVKKIPSMKITDVALACAPNSEQKIIGILPGEKLHEQMVGIEDAPHTYEYSDHYKILPAIHNWSKDPARIKDGRKVSEDFTYCSNNNNEWMSINHLSNWIEKFHVNFNIY
jgi:FlaA1/EpsC-like NDP-sugar epimerase